MGTGKAGIVEGREGTMPTFKCEDIGIHDGFEAKANTREELLQKVAKHAKEVHKIDPVPAFLANEVNKAIKE